MICKKPYNGLFGCGQCIPCRIQKRNIWTSRLVLESFQHSSSGFLTLTYDDEHLPEEGTLVKRDVQLFLKKMRKAGFKVRYFAVGEYGDQTQRPHYHLALFGYPMCDDPPLAHEKRHKPCSCLPCQAIHNLWDKGFSDLRLLERESAQYIAGYVTKKLTRKKTEYEKQQLGNRDPEFATMSRRPGIGAAAMEQLSDTLKNSQAADLSEWDGDVPHQLALGKQKVPLGRYLRAKLRRFYGFEDEAAPKDWLVKKTADVRAMSQVYYEQGEYERTGLHFAESQRQTRLQKVLNIENKLTIFKKRGDL